MTQRLHHMNVDTRGRGLVDVTREILQWVEAQDITTGLLTIWCRHTSASLVVQENASPDVLADLEDFFQRVVPDGGGDLYQHETEGPDDMPAPHPGGAHANAALHPGRRWASTARDFGSTSTSIGSDRTGANSCST